jgi:hypothetical protein
MEQTLLVIAVVGLLAWLFLRHRDKKTEPAGKSTSDSTKSAYHAVSIKYDANACEAAQKMSGRRFLASEAPRLPLPECDAAECNCRFAHHEDRRSSTDRRSPFAASGFGGGTGSFEKERRERKDRRKNADPNDS